VLVTGSGPQDRDEALAGHRPFLVIADYLARRGIAVLRYDDRGVGSSQGSFAEATTFDLTEDAEAAIAFLARHPEIDPVRIGMAGHSEGAIIAAIAASRNPQIAFIIMLAGPGIRGDQLLLLQNAAIGLASGMNPAQIKKANDMNRRLYALAQQKASSEELQRTIAHELEQWIDGDPSLDPAQKTEQKAQVPAMSAQLVSPWMRLFLSLDPSEYLKNVKIPVLAMIGSKDLQVPPEENIPALQKALKEAGNTKSKTLVLQGLNHLFQHAKTGLPAEYAEIEETFAPQALSTMAEFILDVCGR
jgi:pimeloyl-ACP methyl ester carboxylesterase